MTDAIISKANEASTEQLKEMVSVLMDDHQEGSEIVFKIVLDVLEERMSDSEFEAFCDTF